MEKFKSGFVAVIGKTNVGKSSIINRLVGEKISAIANKPQTTRTRIRGIVNRENSQIIFLDTPGLHKSKSKLGNVMIENAISTIPEADIILYVIDASKNGVDERIIEKNEMEKEKELIRNIIKTREELKNANRNFEFADNDLVDYYKYQIKADQAKLSYLIKLAKIKGLEVDMIHDLELTFESEEEQVG